MRHPDDPDIVPTSKASAAFCLALLGAITGIAIGGLIPSTVALVLARQARSDLASGAGWRTGDGHLVWAVRLAWAGIGLALGTLVLLIAIRLLDGTDFGVRDFPATVD